MEKQYNPLVGIAAEELIKNKNLDLLDGVSTRIRKAYADELPSFDGVINNATDTLVTKILLGTLGCVPAYDRYYVQAVKQYGISVGNYNSLHGAEYPMMKLMDMCMWQVAFEENKQNLFEVDIYA